MPSIKVRPKTATRLWMQALLMEIRIPVNGLHDRIRFDRLIYNGTCFTPSCRPSMQLPDRDETPFSVGRLRFLIRAHIGTLSGIEVAFYEIPVARTLASGTAVAGKRTGDP